MDDFLTKEIILYASLQVLQLSAVFSFFHQKSNEQDTKVTGYYNSLQY